MAVRPSTIQAVTPAAAAPVGQPAYAPDVPYPAAGAPSLGRRRWLALPAAIWAAVFAAAFGLARAGLWTPDWAGLAERTPAPWDNLANPWIGPKLLALNGLLAAAFLLAAGGLLALGSRRGRALAGEGILAHARWLLDMALFAGLGVILYAFGRTEPAHLWARLDFLGEPVTLTLPSLVSALLYVAGLIALRPGLAQEGWLRHPVVRLLLAAWTAGLVLYVDKESGAAWAPWLAGVRDAAISLGLWAWLIGYILMVVAATLGHTNDLRHAFPRRRRLVPRGRLVGGGRGPAFALAAARAAVHLALLIAPLIMAAWLTWFLRLDSATTILDRQGRVLQYRYPAGVFRLAVSATDMPDSLCRAVDAVEDAGICTSPATHLPVSLAALGRNLTAATGSAGAGYTGGSGVAAQVCKNVFGRPPVELAGRVLQGHPLAAATAGYKLLVEFPCAWAYERLALLAPPDRRPAATWLNLVSFGRGAYGVEAASLSYFDKPARELEPLEALFLVSRAQAPYAHDPALNPRSATRRTADALALMVRRGFLTAAESEEMAAGPSVLPASPYFPFCADSAPVEAAAAELDGAGFRGLSRRGLIIKTTLDARLQALAEAAVAAGVGRLAGRGASAAALVALDPHTGEVLALAAEPAEAFDLAFTPRQPGSALKPLVYLAAFEQGWTPATVVWDLPLTIDTPQGPYRPTNYDGRFHGPTTVRAALANSYNVPAVRALAFVGIPRFLERARAFGLATLGRPEEYGPSLALGGAEVTLVDLAGAYAALANGGLRAAPHTVLQVRDHVGRLLYTAPNAAQRVGSPEHAYLITDILADNAARTPAFGSDSPLRLDRPAAVKTGTTNDYRDSWTVGYTPDLVVGVWVGNPDRRPMQEVAGALGAAPVWHAFMTAALAPVAPSDFIRPDRVVTAEVCADSGARPAACPGRREELSAVDQPLLSAEADWWVRCEDGRLVLRPDAVADDAGRAWLADWAAEVGAPVGCSPAR